MNTDLKRKAVVFNMADPYQKTLHDYTLLFPNFSAYIKRLIQRDMEGGQIKQKASVENEPIDKTLLNGLI
jgi:hypothetical protein